MDENPYKPPAMPVDPEPRWDIFCIDGYLCWCQVGPDGSPICPRPRLRHFFLKWIVSFLFGAVVGVAFGWCLLQLLNQWATWSVG